MQPNKKLLKNFAHLTQAYAREDLYFEDQMRVGTRTELKRKWTPQGHRPKAPIYIGYESQQTVTITKWGNQPGDIVEGHFNGSLRSNDTGQVFPFIGNFSFTR